MNLRDLDPFHGDTQWMTAGGGLLHIERPPEQLVRNGGLFHGLQLWVNLPKAHRWRARRPQQGAVGDPAQPRVRVGYVDDVPSGDGEIAKTW